MKEKNRSQVQNIDHVVGKNLKKHQTTLNLSQKDIADSLGVSIQQVQKYETCVNRISSGKLYNISKLLNTPIKQFFLNQ
ncbi:helix-turn-helix domain-containing protein [Rickettsiaceae bacterium]|nr:helix-turn-helix domain-containing protein [Rickettsiaceae bacterium]